MGNKKLRKGVKVLEKKRSKRFTQVETDLLCRLVVYSDVNSMATDKTNNRGRYVIWEDIARVYNATSGIQRRDVQALKDRSKNIKRDLKKLAQYAVACKMATGGRFLPPNKPPKVSFDLSEDVKKYAAKMQVKLTGLRPTDSDSLAFEEDLMIVDNNNESTTLPVKEDLFESTSYTLEATSPVVLTSRSLCSSPLLVPVSYSSPLESSSNSHASNSSTVSPPLFDNIQQQSRRKRNINAKSSEPSGSPNSSQMFREKYYESKTALVDRENRRRDELHQIYVDTKKKELAIKNKQFEVWNVALAALQNNTASIADIAKIAHAMQKS